jgi:hypothetical protein
MTFTTPSLRLATALVACVSSLALTGCSAAPAPGADVDAETLDVGEQELGGTVTELVPVDDVVRVACRAEVNKRHCGTAEADKAAKTCAAKLPASAACKANPSTCFKREAKNLSCQATAESYPTLPVCGAPISRNCAFYAQCLDKAVGCGEAGYALGFGEKYCNGFRRTEFSAKGTVWVNSVMLCLQKALVPTVQSATNGYRNASTAPSTAQVCQATLDKAFASHPGCYTQPEASICFLGPADIAKIFGVIGAKEVFTARTTSQITTTVGTCIGQIARAIVGIPLNAPGTNAPAASDDRLVRANIASLRTAARTQELFAQRELWLDYAKQYGVVVTE